MRHDALWERQSCRHQKRRPIHAMEANDFFSDHLQIGGPVFLECILRALMRRSVANRRNVIGQRVQPDVDHMLRIVGNRNAP